MGLSMYQLGDGDPQPLWSPNTHYLEPLAYLNDGEVFLIASIDVEYYPGAGETYLLYSFLLDQMPYDGAFGTLGFILLIKLY